MENQNTLLIYQVTDINANKKTKELYNKILKRQIRNTRILCVSIFLYFLALAWLCGTSTYFENNDQDDIWSGIFLLIIMIATILLAFMQVTKPKEGKIKYQYKNEKFFYLSLPFYTVGVFFLFVMPYNLEEFFTMLALIFIGMGVSLDVYGIKTPGTSKRLNLLSKFIILFFTFLVGYTFAWFLWPDEEEEHIYNYSKYTMVIYDEYDIPNLIATSNEDWYIFTKKDNHYELSASNSPDKLEIVYEINDVEINNLQANDKYAVWCEELNDSVEYLYYDKEDNQIYELIMLDSNEKYPQNINFGLYQDNFYYQTIDYENLVVNINEYNIVTNTSKVIYSLEMQTYEELSYTSLDVSNNHLLVSAITSGKHLIMDFNLSKCSDSCEPNIMEVNQDIEIIHKIIYQNDNYILYYNNKLGIFDKNGQLETEVYTFKPKHFAYNNKIIVDDEALYWLDFNNDDNDKDGYDYNLMIYNFENQTVRLISKMFDIIYSGNTLYALGYYQGKMDNVWLYKIYN